jgi:ribosomal protein S17
MISVVVKKIIDSSTIVGEFSYLVMDKKYKKFVKKKKKYLAHVLSVIPGLSVGNSVIIKSCSPVSKRKSWELVKINK